ncbi:MAG: ATP-binding cassette domain-containing protein, partial [Ruminiclostridium sp.]|nr:ATP-binding cassette domain-containing protein [Ruminiclostridium sp.]
MSETIIEVKNLTKQYMKQQAVKNASFKIEEGMICGLIGPNGAGKTTIMKMLGGLVIPTEGSISIYGKTDEEELVRARQRTSFIIENPYAKEKMKARENLEKQRIQKVIPDKSRIDEVLKIVGLENTG